MLVADCDLRAGFAAKRWFDSVGHYCREDVLRVGGTPPPEPEATSARYLSLTGRVAPAVRPEESLLEMFSE